MSPRRSTFLVVGYVPAEHPPSRDALSKTDIHAGVHRMAAERGGRIVETTSRDLVAAFPDPAAAVDCALALQRAAGSGADELAGWDRRIGIDAAASETETDFDQAIEEARRLREMAESGAIRISLAVFAAARTRMGLEWSAAPETAGTVPAVPESHSDRARTRTVASPPPNMSLSASARRTSQDPKTCLALTLAGSAAVGWIGARSWHAREWNPGPAPLRVGIVDARTGSLFSPSPDGEGTPLLLTVGVTNSGGREVELRRQDFRLTLRGEEVKALSIRESLPNHSDTRATAYLPHRFPEAFRFEHRKLPPGGSAIIGLRFDCPPEMSGRERDERRPHRYLNPLDFRSSGRLVERLGTGVPALYYRGASGRLRVDLATDPFDRRPPAVRPSQLGPDVTVYPTTAPVHIFNARRLWSFVEQELSRDDRAVIVDMRDWPSPDPAVRAYLQRRGERTRDRRIAFVADGAPFSSTLGGFQAPGPGTLRVWFARETDAAAQLIGRVERGHARLLQLSTSPDAHIRVAALDALTETPSRMATRLFLERLAHDPSPWARATAAQALARKEPEDPYLDRVLAQAAADEHEMVRKACLGALVRREAWSAGRAPALRELERKRPIPWAVRLVGEARAKPALPRLLGLLHDPALSFEAARALGKLGDPTAVPELLAALDLEFGSRQEIIRAAGRLANASQRETVARALDATYRRYSDFPLRQAVMEAAGELGGPEALRLCLDGMQDQQFPVRQAAARALGRLKANSAVVTLENALIDPAVARDAAEALRAIHTPAARQALDRASRCSNLFAQSAAGPVLATWDR